MNNSDSTTPANNSSANSNSNSNSNSHSNSNSPSKEKQQGSSTQTHSSPKNVGGDQKNETAKTDIVKENKDVTAR